MTKSRIKTSYNANHTASISMIQSILKKKPDRKKISDLKQREMAVNKLIKLKDDPMKLLKIFKNNIIEHYNRKIDLYFYLLVAYYDTGVKIKLKNPILQHGESKGTKRILNAAHDSLIANLERQGKYNLSHTHFIDSLNSTIELPRLVNELDQYLEGKITKPSPYRKEALLILQEVAKGNLNPMAGLECYLEIMRSAFAKFESDKHTTPIETRRKLINLANKGTFFTTSDRRKYICSLLRLDSNFVKWEDLMAKIKIIQNEIWSTRKTRDIEQKESKTPVDEAKTMPKSSRSYNHNHFFKKQSSLSSVKSCKDIRRHKPS